MNRTARMLRRTLLCAVLACPLSLWRMEAAAACMALFAALPGKSPALWYSGPFGISRKRALFSLGWGLLLTAALSRAAPQPLLRPLCVLTGLLTQCTLILRIQRPEKKRQTGGALAALLALLLLFVPLGV